MSSTRLTVLRKLLAGVAPGPLSEEVRAGVLGHLQSAWADFEGCDATGMTGHKLDRWEDVRWEPPILQFRLERHGAIVAGRSTRGELYAWEVDVDGARASCTKHGHRQLYPSAPRLDVGQIAKRVAADMRQCESEQRDVGGAKYVKSTGRAKPNYAAIPELSAESAVGQTLTARRKRFNEALKRECAEALRKDDDSA